jgi:electron transport complex protein RnfC
MGLLGRWRRKSFSHGIHPTQWKDETRIHPIRRLPFAPRMILPLSQHIGAPAVPIVKKGQEVVRGEPIARADGWVSSPIHAPVTGVIRGIELMPTAKGPKAEAIVLDAYEGSSQEVLYTHTRDITALSQKEVVQAIQDSGMVGLGGAAFPSHVKFLPPAGIEIDTLLVNGCECEPYLTTDHRIMLEHTDALLTGIRIAMQTIGAKQTVIGIEDNKLDAVAAIEARLVQEDAIRVGVVQTKYPQGADKVLIRTLLDREVPSGGHSYDIGVVVNNVGTLSELGRLLPSGQGLVERVVTVTGPGVKRPGNYSVPIGTPMHFLLEQTGFKGSAQEVILGGPMMGGAVASLDVPVTKGVSGILVLSEEIVAKETRSSYHCIKCARCVGVCPMNLNPSMLGQLAAKREYEIMEQRYHLNDCFECGCCSYVCPSNIPLTQYFRIAKAMNLEAKAREQAA